MFELIYPFDSLAPFIPSGIGRDRWMEPSEGGTLEIFPIVETSGLVTGRSSRRYCHSGAKVLHPVVHLHIIDRSGNLYLQKRSFRKDIQPGKWDTAVGGHVDYGESLTEALIREASEELGLREFNPVYLESYVFESEIEKELVNVFATVGHFTLTPDYDELEEGRYWPMEEIISDLGKSVFTPNFEGEITRIRETLLSLL